MIGDSRQAQRVAEVNLATAVLVVVAGVECVIDCDCCAWCLLAAEA